MRNYQKDNFNFRFFLTVICYYTLWSVFRNYAIFHCPQQRPFNRTIKHSARMTRWDTISHFWDRSQLQILHNAVVLQLEKKDASILGSEITNKQISCWKHQCSCLNEFLAWKRTFYFSNLYPWKHDTFFFFCTFGSSTNVSRMIWVAIHAIEGFFDLHWCC